MRIIPNNTTIFAHTKIKKKNDDLFLMLGHIDKHAYEGQFTKKSSQT
jgi:hypothetical protein